MNKLFTFFFIVFYGSFNLINSEWQPLSFLNRNIHFTATSDHYHVLPGLELESDSTKTCVDCHDKKLIGPEVHSPAKKDCQRCHVSNNEVHPAKKTKGFNLKKSVPELCYECHDPKDEEEFVHEPSEKGDCLLCHDIHSSENLYLVKENPVSLICLECHDLKIPEDNLIHGAVSDGDCTGCHNPHQANNKEFMASSNLGRLCKKCHKSIKKEFKNEHVHDPFKKKKCFECHNAHSSKEEHLSDLKTKDLCFSCHDDIHKQVESANNIHGAIDEVGSCLNCHSSHSSSHEKILKFEDVELCLSCHDKLIKTNTGHIKDIGTQLKDGNYIHAPITEDGCSVCHEPHVSQDISLLKDSFPSGTYVNVLEDNFALCFRCHDEKLILDKTTDSSTNFRDGNINLHFIHINGEKGRNCNVCHDVHGAENKYMIKQTTAYGSWEMPITYKLYEDGGSCLTGCHKESRYVREIENAVKNIDSLQVNDTLIDMKE